LKAFILQLLMFFWVRLLYSNAFWLRYVRHTGGSCQVVKRYQQTVEATFGGALLLLCIYIFLEPKFRLSMGSLTGCSTVLAFFRPGKPLVVAHTANLGDFPVVCTKTFWHSLLSPINKMRQPSSAGPPACCTLIHPCWTVGNNQLRKNLEHSSNT
jgi:hypothetical protein